MIFAVFMNRAKMLRLSGCFLPRLIGKNLSASVAVLLFAIAFLLLLAFSAFAENISLYGLQLEVDEHVRLDERSAKVSVFGETRIVDPSEVVSLVLSQYISHDKLLEYRPVEDVEAALEQSVSADDQPVSVQLLLAYLSSSSVSDSKKESFLYKHRQTPKFEPVFLEIMKSHGDKISPRFASFLIIHLGVKDFDQIRKDIPAQIFRNREVFLDTAEKLVERLGESGIESGFSLSAASLCEKLFGLDNPQVQRIALMVQKLEAILAIPISLDRAELYPFLGDDISRGPFSALRPLVLKKIYQFVQFALKQKQPISSLILLSEVRPDERSEQTQSLISSAVAQIRSPVREMRTNRTIASLLEEESRNSLVVRRAYLGYLQMEFSSLIDSRQLRAAGLVREEMSQIDNSGLFAEDEMIYREARAWFRAKQLDRGESLLQLRSRPLTLQQNLSLLMAGRFGNPLQYVLWALIPVLLLLLLYFRRVERAREEKRREEAKHEGFAESLVDDNTTHSQTHMGSTFQNLTGRRSPELTEYNRLMEELGLPPGAGLADIKSQYRQKIKRVHPDALKRPDGEASDEFLVLSRMYERILELGKTLGLRS